MQKKHQIFMAKTKKQSAGILLYRSTDSEPEVFLVHPGGPFWKNKDEGAWTIPKGEFDDSEDPLLAAIREFKEETGFNIKGEFIPLGSIQQKAGKTVYAWAIAGDIDETNIKSNFFEMEWPPKSGKKMSFPEIDKGGWFIPAEAQQKINATQSAFIDELLYKI